MVLLLSLLGREWAGNASAAAPCAGALLWDTCFEFNATPLPWAEAEAACGQQGGNLASILSTQEAFIAQALCEEACWIGFTDATFEGHWTWSDGNLANFSGFPGAAPPWNPGEPNGQRYETTDAAYMYRSSNAWVTAGRWDDDDMKHAKPYLCKRLIRAEVVGPMATSCAGEATEAVPLAIAMLGDLVILIILYRTALPAMRWARRTLHLFPGAKRAEREPLTSIEEHRPQSEQIELL